MYQDYQVLTKDVAKLTGRLQQKSAKARK